MVVLCNPWVELLTAKVWGLQRCWWQLPFVYVAAVLRLRGIRDSGLSVQDLRQKLLVRMDDLVSAARKIFRLARIKKQIKRIFVKETPYLTWLWLVDFRHIFACRGALWRVANVYVLDMTEADNVSWRSFSVGKKGMLTSTFQNRLLTKAVQVTEKDMVVRFTGDHFELMEPVETTIYPNNDLFLETLLDIVGNRSYAETAAKGCFMIACSRTRQIVHEIAGRSLELRAFLITTFNRLSCLDGSVSKTPNNNRTL